MKSHGLYYWLVPLTILVLWFVVCFSIGHSVYGQTSSQEKIPTQGQTRAEMTLIGEIGRAHV